MNQNQSNRKQMVEEYKNMKHEMGVIVIKCEQLKKCHVVGHKNTRTFINGATFKLNAGSYVNRELQSDYTKWGKDKFTIEVAEVLPYDDDETKTDYAEELEILQMEWEEKMTAQGYAVIVNTHAKRKG